MSKRTYSLMLYRLASSDTFPEASREELRVLLCLAAKGGQVDSDDSLALLAGVSLARVRSALALWEESGVISLSGVDISEELGSQFAEVIDEYEDRRALVDAIDEEESVRVAVDIRDGGLSELLEEIARLMNQSALNTQEIKNVTALYSQLGLSAEYILTLAAFIDSKGRLTTKKLVSKAEKLVKDEIDTLERLEAYVRESANESAATWEFKKFFRIPGRLSLSEAEMFKRWSEEYGYGINIVEAAYDVAANYTSGPRLKYTDTVLKGWHEAGCKTVKECTELYESGRMKLELDKLQSSAPKKKKTSEVEVPKYSEFNSEDALMRALERSYQDNN